MSIFLASHMRRKYQRVYRTLERLDPADKAQALVAPGSASPRGNIIVFPGSFNPPTLAHVAMLRQARKYAYHAGEDCQIYAAMSKQIVDKETVARMSLLDRVVLLQRVLEQEVRHAGILLLNRGLYVEQARGIRNSFAHIHKLYFLLGFDKIVQILDPRYYQDRDQALHELFGLAQLLVAPRENAGAAELHNLLNQAENRPFARYIHPLPLDNSYRSVSSTLARQGNPAGLRELPTLVRDFITRTRPYLSVSDERAKPTEDLYARRTQAIQQLCT